MEHSTYFKALFVCVLLGLYNLYAYSSPGSQPAAPHGASHDWQTQFVSRLTSSNKPFYEFSGVLEQSPGDKRQHKLIKLPNGIVALCTQDADATEAAAALSVNVGSLAESSDLLGMAHFLEHMLFMGSGKYPDENNYTKYIANNMGTYNAYTADFETTYFFSVANPAFEGALDRLSRFFIDPLLNPSSIDREVHAVDSEYKGNLQTEGWRINELGHHLSNPSHPYSQFSIGNLETLQDAAKLLGVGLHEKVVQFYQQYYSADIMKLAVAGNHSVAQLADWVVEKFSEVPSQGNTKPELPGHPLGSAQLGQVVHMQSLANINILLVEFALPDIRSLYQQDPTLYLAKLAGSEMPGSLLHYLKQQGWAISVHAHLHGLNEGFEIFPFAIELTPEGLHNYEQVLEAMFAYLQMLRDLGPQKPVHDEIKSVDMLDFKFYQQPKTMHWVVDMASGSHNEHIIPAHYLTKDSVVRDFDYQAIANILGYFTMQNYRAFVIAQNHSVECLDREKYFDIAYNTAALPAKLTGSRVMDWKSYGFHLPKPNSFLPDNTDVLQSADEVSEVAKEPRLLQANSTHELWFKQDDQHFTPRGSIYLKLKLSNEGASVKDVVAAAILDACIAEVFYEEFEPARHAGMQFKVDLSVSRLAVRVTGFSNKLPALLNALLARIQTFEVQPHIYDIVMTQVKQGFENAKYAQPIRQLGGERKQQLNKVPFWSTQSMQAVVDTLTIDLVQQQIKHIFAATYFKMLVVGNFIEADAKQAAEKVHQMLDTDSQPSYAHVPWRVVDIQPGHYIYMIQSDDPNKVNNAVLVTFYCGPTTSNKHGIVMMLLSQMLHDQFFDQLRTKEQLGYSAYAQQTSLGSGKRLLEFGLQGESNPIYMTQRIDSFIAQFRQYIVEFTAEKFDVLVESIISSIQERPQTVYKEANGYWSSVNSGTYDFRQVEKQVEQLQQVKLDDVLEVWDMYVNPETATDESPIRVALEAAISPKRVAEVVHRRKTVDYTMIGMVQTPEGKWVIGDIDKFKAVQPLHGLPVPAIKLEAVN
ncbi:metalloprotease [Coemansia sp. Cherry 401B]|nr:metalloprotease [Coemansia sp. Cherry 401B]